MKIRLTESDLIRIVKRVVNEEEETFGGNLPMCKKFQVDQFLQVMKSQNNRAATITNSPDKYGNFLMLDNNSGTKCACRKSDFFGV